MIKSKTVEKTRTKKVTLDRLYKIFVFMFALATVLTLVVAFVGKHMTPLYGTKVGFGFGIIMFFCAWATWLSAANSKKPLSPTRFIMPALSIGSACLLPTISTFIMATLFIVIVVTYFVLEDKIKPKEIESK